MSSGKLSVTVYERHGADTCEGQKMARCCIGNICVDAPVEPHVKSGEYDIASAVEDPVLKFCVEAIRARALTAARSALACHPHEGARCVKRFVEYIGLAFGGPVLLVGYNERVAEELNAVSPYIYVYDPNRIGPKPFEFVDETNLADVLYRVNVVVIVPGAASSVNIADMVSLAKRAGKPVIAYGVSFAGLAKQLGIAYFCPFGR